jgi:hypothetical protein
VSLRAAAERVLFILSYRGERGKEKEKTGYYLVV